MASAFTANHIVNILDFKTLEVIPPCFSKGLKMQSGHRQRESSATRSTPHIHRSSGGPQSQGARRHERLEVVKEHLSPSTEPEKTKTMATENHLVTAGQKDRA